MARSYIDQVKGSWQDDVGRRENAAVNDAVQVLNAAASDMDDMLRKVEQSQSRTVNFQPRTPEIMDIKERLERELR